MQHLRFIWHILSGNLKLGQGNLIIISKKYGNKTEKSKQDFEMKTEDCNNSSVMLPPY